MMPLIRWWSLVPVLLLLINGMIIRAQDALPTLPLLAVANGVVLQQTDGHTVTPYPQCQPPEGILSSLWLSPAGTHFIMETQPDLVRQAILAGGGIGGGPLPSNFFLCDRTTNTLYKIADQPVNASFFAGDVPDNVTVRSAPAWAPDAKGVAWVEQTSGNPVYNLMVFDLTQLLVFPIPLAGLPEPAGIPAPYPTFWGEAGILVDVLSLDPTTFQLTEAIYTFDGRGSFLSGAIIFTGGEDADVIVERILIKHQGSEYLGLLYRGKGWVLVDPKTGAEQPMPGIPELYSPTAPDGLSLLVALDASYNYHWQVVDYVGPDGLPQQFSGYGKQRMAISPDGKMLAFAGGIISLWQNGTTTPLAGSEAFGEDFRAGMVWGPLAWRVKEGTNFVSPAPLSGG